MDQASAIHKARTSFAENTTPEALTEYIRKRGSKWVILSKKGKVLGTYDSHKAAAKRLGQIEYFKHRGESLEIFDQAVATVRAGVPSSTLSESLQIVASCMADDEDGDPLTEETGREVLRLVAGIIKAEGTMARVQTIKVVSPSSSLRNDGYIEIDGVRYTLSTPINTSGWDDLERLIYEIKKGGYNTRKIDYFFRTMKGFGFRSSKTSSEPGTGPSLRSDPA